MTLAYIANARFPSEKAHSLQISKMCEAFALRGLRVRLLYPFRRQPEGARGSLFEFYGIPEIFETAMLPNRDLLWLDRFLPSSISAALFLAHALAWGRAAAAEAERLRPSICYTRDLTVAYWLVRRGLPAVYEAHSVPRRAQLRWLRRILRHPALLHTVALTSFIRERLIRLGCVPSRISVAHDAADLRAFEDLPSRRACRERLGLPPDAFIAGYVGRFRTLDMEKGIPELLAAMQVLDSRGVRPLLVCVGGPMEAVPAYLRQAERLGLSPDSVRFLDRVSSAEVPLWLRAFDLGLAPFPDGEHYARFMSPLKIFEYMAAGLPIVASDLPSLREVLTDGVNALLVPPGDANAVADAIESLWNGRELAASLAVEARRSAAQYTWSERASAILERIV